MSTVTTLHRQDLFRRLAACRDEDPELFFPLGDTGPALLQIDYARQVCQTCPLMTSCADQALINGEMHGVWGGLSEDDRAWLRDRARDELRASWSELTRVERDSLLTRLTVRLRVSERDLSLVTAPLPLSA